MFGLENINSYLSEFTGNHSVMMRLLESRMIEFAKDKRSGLHEDEYYMFYEFSLFEDDYFTIKKDLINSNIDKCEIVDIGCQFGFQSEIFKEYQYIGIDCRHDFFFNQEESNINYINGIFPNSRIDITGKIVISNMSLGYFNDYIDDKGVDDKLVEELSKSKILYCNSRPDFIEKLKKEFKYHKFIGKDRFMKKEGNTSKISTSVYKFWN